MALRTTLPSKEAKGNHAHVVQVAVGREHAALLTDEGIVYSWGTSNEHGQLGRAQGTEQEATPVTDTVRSEIIVQVACGNNHCLALTQRGTLFAWGANKAGQLGVAGFRAGSSHGSEVRKPTAVKGFDGSDPARLAKSCSCGPESSACVTTRGEVYVWGAVSYYLFGNGSRYDADEDCTAPVRVRGVPTEACRLEDFAPDQIALYKDKFVCTIARSNVKDDLMDLIKRFKMRHSQLVAVSTKLRQEARAMRAEADDDGLELGELKSFDKHLKEQHEAYGERLRNIDTERATLRQELQRISRELLICDQQETALTERAVTLEMERSEKGTGRDGPSRTLETQLNDINHFKLSSKRSKLQLLAQRDRLEREYLQLAQESTMMNRQRKETNTRSRLIRSLQHGDLGNKGPSSIDDGLKIAFSKREELGATNLQRLAGAGRFNGFREVLSVSDRALQDVSSALKEVSAAAAGPDGTVLEELLEANLKLRKESNGLVQEKLLRAERGGRGAGSSAALVPRAKEASGSSRRRREESDGGMLQFFLETKQGTQQAAPQGGTAARKAATFLGLPGWSSAS